MNYKLKKLLFLPLSPFHMRGYMVSTIGGKQLVMKIFSPVSTQFYWLSILSILFIIGNCKLPKTITQKSETIIIVKSEMIMEKNYKRQYRECPMEVRKKISAKMKGRKKSDMTKQRISMGMKNYWRDVPSLSGSDFTSTGRIVWLVFYENFLYIFVNNKGYHLVMNA